jgi:SAM-dependent methyltransferase
MASWCKGYSQRHAHRLANDLYFIEQYADKKTKIIEFGSTPPVLTLSLKWLGYDVTGVDLNPARFASSISAHGLNVIECDIECKELPMQNHIFDLVIFNELFEHLRINPIFTFREMKRILKPGGMLLLSTPNLRSLHGLTNFLFRNRSYALCGDIHIEYQKLELHGHMGHVREYTTGDVQSFLRAMGFSLDGLIYREGSMQLRYSAIWRIFPRLRPFVTYIARAT